MQLCNGMVRGSHESLSQKADADFSPSLQFVNATFRVRVWSFYMIYLRNAKHMPLRDKTCLLLIGETKVDLGEMSANRSIISDGHRMSYAKFRVDEARHALDLVDLVERFKICCVEGHDLEVLCDPGCCDGLGEGSDAAGD
jgi:hypothetical protein